jgi:hypothetical protein
LDNWSKKVLLVDIYEEHKFVELIGNYYSSFVDKFEVHNKKTQDNFLTVDFFALSTNI